MQDLKFIEVSGSIKVVDLHVSSCSLPRVVMRQSISSHITYMHSGF
jgi:hypothetical protein